jgi:hypothetical protein
MSRSEEACAEAMRDVASGKGMGAGATGQGVEAARYTGYPTPGTARGGGVQREVRAALGASAAGLGAGGRGGDAQRGGNAWR